VNADPGGGADPAPESDVKTGEGAGKQKSDGPKSGDQKSDGPKAGGQKPRRSRGRKPAAAKGEADNGDTPSETPSEPGARPDTGVGGEEPGEGEGKTPAKRRRARKTSDAEPSEGGTGDESAAA
jgi:hypothetical protein